MAIQGYSSTGNAYVMSKVQTIYGAGANDQLLADMLALFDINISPSQAQEYLSDLLVRADASGYPNLLDEEGKLDIGLLYPPSGTPSIFEECDIIGQPDGTFHAMVIRGKWTIIANLDAYVNLMAQIAQNVPTEIEPPQIEFVSSNFAVGVDIFTGMTGSTEVISFCATFYTKYGETNPSNIIMSPITNSGWTCEVGLSKLPHSLVEKVYYYRTFNGVFRRVKEISVNG